MLELFKTVILVFVASILVAIGAISMTVSYALTGDLLASGYIAIATVSFVVVAWIVWHWYQDKRYTKK